MKSFREMNYENVLKFKHVEEAFMKSIQDLGSTRLCTKEEDYTEHWDVKLEANFDVKAVKKVNRSDGSTNENIHYVEIYNVQGKLGWLYGGADYFSFETDDYWVVVAKKSLQDFIAKKCAAKAKCEKPELYKLYSRTVDVITLVKTIDLMYISEKIIPK